MWLEHLASAERLTAPEQVELDTLTVRAREGAGRAAEYVVGVDFAPPGSRDEMAITFVEP